nr:KTSC domain-containing protein [Granulicella sp. S190]
MTPESSTLSRIRYEAASQVLTVDFRSAGIYEFYEVPANLYQEMIESNLKGDFLSERIRGHFRYAKT